MLIWHGMMPHEGTQIRNHDLTRKSLVTHFTSATAYPGYFKKPDAEAQGLFTEMHGGRYYDYV